MLNWGESTFIPNGINAINHFDVSKLRLPGSELREALLPVALASVAVAPTDTVSVEGFYQFDWEETEIDPVGSYFSTNDYVGSGANKVVIPKSPGPGDMGLTAQNNPFVIFSRTSVAAAFSAVTQDDPNFLVVGREADHEPDDSGQWGIAFRYLAEDLNNTEFGLSSSRTTTADCHSSVAHTGTAADAGAGLLRAGTIAGAGPTAAGELVSAAVSRCPGRVPVSDPHGEAGMRRNCFQHSARSLEPNFRSLSSGRGSGGGSRDAYVKENGHYFVEYPEDIQLYGVSFNTEIGATGWALQGEYSYRRDAPFQLAERKVLEDALGPFTSCLARASA